MKRWIYLLLLPFFFACQQAEEQDNTPEGNLEALWKIIDEHYCFLDYKAEAIGLDWNRVRSDYRSRLNPKMTQAQLFEVLAAMLSELRDGHVNLYTSLDVARNWSWREDHPANFDKELQDAYLGTGTDYHIASGLKYRILDDNIGYVVVNSFSTPIGEGNLDDMLYFLRLTDGLIIDVRNNTGGELTTAERLARRFTNERRLVGYICHKTGRGHNDFSTPEAQYIAPSNGVRWQKPVVVLTNCSCYSATNTFVRDMKAIAAAVEAEPSALAAKSEDTATSYIPARRILILGDQTGGGSGLPFSSELPNGWSVRFSACPMFDAEGQHIEFGIQPHIPCTLLPADQARGHDTLIERARQILRGRK